MRQEGLRFQEIARIQQVNENTVRSRRNYAVSKLREELRRAGLVGIGLGLQIIAVLGPFT